MSNPVSTRTPDHAPRVTGVILGLLIFLAGVALVGYVFLSAKTLFDTPPPLIPANAFATPSPTPSAVIGAVTTPPSLSPAASTATTVISQNLSNFVEKLLLLLVMCIVGSVVAWLGSILFFKSLAAPRHIATGVPVVPVAPATGEP